MKRRKIQPVAGIGALVVAVLAGTLVLCAAKEPESARAVSSDGIVEVVGATSPSLGALVVARRDDVPSFGMVPAYEVSLGGLPAPVGFTIVLEYEDASLGGVAPNALSAFAFAEDAQAWIAVPSIVDPAAQTVTSEAFGSGARLWTIGPR